MKRSLFACLALCLTVASTRAADDVKLKLSDAKFTLGEGVSTELAGYDYGESKIFYYAPATAEWTFKVAADGTFDILVRASCDPAKEENAKFKLTIDGKDVGEEVSLTSEYEKDYKLETKLAAGEHKLTIAFTNDVYEEGVYDRNLYLHKVSLKAKE